VLHRVVLGFNDFQGGRYYHAGLVTAGAGKSWRFDEEMLLLQINVERRNYAWFALAGAERCRLLCCRLTQHGTQYVEQRGVLENAVSEHVNPRPATEGEETHDIEETELRFARDTAEWLNQNAADQEMTRLVVFATPRMLGLLRRTSFYVTNGHLAEAGDKVMRLQASELADHPLVRDVIRARHSR